MHYTCILFIAPRESYHVCTAHGNCLVTVIRRTMLNEMVVNIFLRIIPWIRAYGSTVKKTTKNPEKKNTELLKYLT